MLSFLFIIAGLALISFGSNYLVDGASAIARRLNVSDLVIGLTVVALGTSAPELVVNLFASLGGNTDLAIANVLGSNIFNVLVILGISALIFPLRLYSNTVRIEIPLTLLAAIMGGIFANDMLVEGGAASMISRSEGFGLLGFFMVFMFYSFIEARKKPPEGLPSAVPLMPVWKMLLFVAGGLTGLILGGKLMVDGAVDIARNFGLSENIIGITIVATGTSLPELATSVAAALKKNTDMAIGNVIGSNIFNIFFVLGISSVIRPLPFNELTNIDVVMTILVSILLQLFAFITPKHLINRPNGAVFLLLYVVYIGFMISKELQ